MFFRIFEGNHNIDEKNTNHIISPFPLYAFCAIKHGGKERNDILRSFCPGTFLQDRNAEEHAIRCNM